ncbi:MAG: cobyric acid synthase [Thermoguttaceae bacterium]
MSELRTDALSVGYNGATVVSEIALMVKPGRIVTLIGPNGSGKSTALRTVAGALPPVCGVVWYNDCNLASLKRSELARTLAVMTTSRNNPEYATGFDVVSVGRHQFTGILGRLTPKDVRAIDNALALVGAHEFRDVNFSYLSDGQKQRVLLARALVQEPEIMILDEPTSYLDVGYKLEFIELLKKLVADQKIGVLAALHELELVRSVSDEVVCLSRDGRVDRVGSVAEVFDTGYIKKLFDIRTDGFEKTYGFITNGERQTVNKTALQPAPCRSNATRRVKYLMVQGTMSSAGKSLITTGLCRILTQDGLRVAPFKSQNMALNSFVTSDGLEMGRAQVMQAEACGREPSVWMNPILLKPTDDCGSQVIVNGRVVGNMRAQEYFEYKTRLVPEIRAALDKLGETSDVVIIEGAGSPAEINLKRNDIVNMGLAKMIDAPVLLVGDIDRGGVFAQLLGTLELLEPEERARVKGLIFNKFRGDKSLLDSGITALEERCGVPVAGVVPYIRLTLDDEDSLSERLERTSRALVNIGVIRFPFLANFTDFYVFEQFEDVAVTYITRPEEVASVDMLILPGSKNAIASVKWLESTGLARAIREYAASGAPVVGVGGGYQALGTTIVDPDGVEGGGETQGLGLLPVATTLRPEKQLRRIRGEFIGPEGAFAKLAGVAFTGYEIHMGETRPTESGTCAEFTSDGTGWSRGSVYGTYVHGVFDDAEVAKGVVSALARRKGVALDASQAVDYRTLKEREYDRLADTLRAALDMDLIYNALGMRPK